MSETTLCEICGKEMRDEPGYNGLFHVNETDAVNCFRAQREKADAEKRYDAGKQVTTVI
jgi:hypothetical protein